jgi:hydrogenase/urease accessory protein HupE
VAGRGRRLVAAITGFTVAHSLTLALSTLDLVHVPIPPVEAVIALSIVFLATEIARGNKQSLAYRKPILVSSCFGLLHGFGFAAVLQAIGLPQSDVPLALLFFNLGVEFGQLVFIGAVIGLTMVGLRLAPVFSREKVSFALQRAAVYGIGILASYWMIERIAGFV